MSEQWIIQVEGRDYGPADLDALREWKSDGRVLPHNAARLSDSDAWVRAADIPSLFEASELPRPASEIPPWPSRGILGICGEAFRIYFKGFWPFLGLTLLVLLPSVCAQVTGAFLETSRAADVDLRTFLAAGFSLCMLCLTLAAWPIYLAGLQILSFELASGRRIGFFALLNDAVKFWGRVALLCIFTYGAFIFWTLAPLLVILMIMLGGPSLLSAFGVLTLGILQVWMVGKLFVNFMFWQQFAVLEGGDVTESLRESKDLARGGRELVWYRRPMWRGVFIFSLWSIFVFAINLPAIWPELRDYWHLVNTTQDPQALVQAMRAVRPAHAFSVAGLGLGVLQAVVRPWLGIAFVLIFLEARSQRVSESDSRQT